MLFLLLALGSIIAAAYLVLEAVTLPAQQRRSLVRRAADYGRMKAAPEVEREKFSERALAPLKENLASWVLRLNPKASVEAISRKLLAAGLERRISPTGFLALKGVGVLVGVLFGLLVGSGGKALLLALAFGFVGYKAPDFVVMSKARRRKTALRRALPDALDLLAVSVEAGLGFDGAIMKLMDHMEGPLAEEFALTLGEMRIGRSRHEALKNLADRTDLPEMSAFTRAIIQADQLGISLGRILRVQASDTRIRRQAEAEEMAMKAPIKMMFPTAIFIFPAMFIVILGPAVLGLAETF